MTPLSRAISSGSSASARPRTPRTPNAAANLAKVRRVIPAAGAERDLGRTRLAVSGILCRALGRFVEAARRKLIERSVGLLCGIEQLPQLRSGLLLARFSRPGDQRAVAGDGVVLHGLDAGDQASILNGARL